MRGVGLAEASDDGVMEVHVGAGRVAEDEEGVAAEAEGGAGAEKVVEEEVVGVEGAGEEEGMDLGEVTEGEAPTEKGEEVRERRRRRCARSRSGGGVQAPKRVEPAEAHSI